MDMPKDPVMLLSYINLKLRDYYTNLDALCDDLDVDKQYVIDTLKSIDYIYDEALNTFV